MNSNQSYRPPLPPPVPPEISVNQHIPLQPHTNQQQLPHQPMNLDYKPLLPNYSSLPPNSNQYAHPPPQYIPNQQNLAPIPPFQQFNTPPPNVTPPSHVLPLHPPVQGPFVNRPPMHPPPNVHDGATNIVLPPPVLPPSPANFPLNTRMPPPQPMPSFPLNSAPRFVHTPFNPSLLPNFGNHSQGKLSDDQIWVKQWSDNVKRDLKSPACPKTTLKISEARALIQQALSYTNLLHTLRSEMVHLLEASDDVWVTYYNTVITARKQLTDIMKILKNNTVMVEIERKVKKRQAKRKRLKRKRQNDREEYEKTQQRNFFVGEQISQNLQQMTEKIIKKKQDEEMKKEADCIMSEVRKKISDSMQTQQLLNSLEKLRSIRQHSAKQKGLFTSEQNDKDFNATVDHLKNLMEKQIANYRSEEKALKVMVESEQEVQREEQRSKMQAVIDKSVQDKRDFVTDCLFGAQKLPPAPLMSLWSYFTQSDLNIENLIYIRRTWDVYINESKEASGIPISWVNPSAPSSDEWSKYLQVTTTL